MIDTFAQAVNQKMAFASALLAQSQLPARSPVLEKACLESACFQMYAAYRLYLRELAQQYVLPDESFEDAEALQQAFFQDQRISPEVAELIELLGRNGSWLSGLLRNYRLLFERSGAGRSLSQTPGSDVGGLIGTVQLSAESLSVEDLSGCLTSFQDVLQRQRQSMLEC